MPINPGPVSEAGQGVPSQQAGAGGVLSDLSAQALATQEAETALATVITEAQAIDPAVANAAGAEPAAQTADATVVADVAVDNP